MYLIFSKYLNLCHDFFKNKIVTPCFHNTTVFKHAVPWDLVHCRGPQVLRFLIYPEFIAVEQIPPLCSSFNRRLDC